MKKNFVKRAITSACLFLVLALWMFIGSAFLATTFGIRPEWSAYSFMAINSVILLLVLHELLGLRKKLGWSLLSRISCYILALVFLWVPIGNETFGPYEYNKHWYSPWIGILVWIFLLFLFFLLTLSKKNNFIANDFIYATTWIIYLALTFKAINFLMLQAVDFQKLGWPTMLYLWVIVISNDIGAYLGGTFYGKRKLAPKISPQKTWEGAITGFSLSTALSTILVTLFLQLSHYQVLPIYRGPLGLTAVYFVYIFISMVLSVLSQLGDLMFSALKRNHEAKDFSNIFPGHGGIMDRLDSFSLVAIFTFLLTMAIL